MEIRAAGPEEEEAVVSFYGEMIDKMQACEYRPTWKLGVYPTGEGLRALVEKRQVFLGLEGQRIVAAMVLNHDCNESYADVHWETSAAEDEITVLHLLCVLPEFGGGGRGRQMLDFARNYAAAGAQKVIRLDVMEENLPAIRLYDAAGFRRLETRRMFYESTGWTNFVMYEYALVNTI